jgi:hypothetical protein
VFHFSAATACSRQGAAAERHGGEACAADARRCGDKGKRQRQSENGFVPNIVLLSRAYLLRIERNCHHAACHIMIVYRPPRRPAATRAAPPRPFLLCCRSYLANRCKREGVRRRGGVHSNMLQSAVSRHHCHLPHESLITTCWQPARLSSPPLASNHQFLQTEACVCLIVKRRKRQHADSLAKTYVRLCLAHCPFEIFLLHQRPELAALHSRHTFFARRCIHFSSWLPKPGHPRAEECYTSHVTRHTSHVTRHASHVTRHTSHVSRVTRHTSHVTRHTSHVTRHTSHIARHTSPEAHGRYTTGHSHGKPTPARAHPAASDWAVSLPKNAQQRCRQTPPPSP